MSVNSCLKYIRMPETSHSNIQMPRTVRLLQWSALKSVKWSVQKFEAVLRHQFCRFHDGIRNRRFKKGFTDYNIKWRYRKRQDQCPDRISQMQDICINNVSGEHTTVENHRDKNHPGIKTFQFISISWNNISHRRCQQYWQNNTKRGNQNGNECCM